MGSAHFPPELASNIIKFINNQNSKCGSVKVRCVKIIVNCITCKEI